MSEIEKTTLGIHFKVFKQHVEFLHRETDSYLDATGVLPLSTFQGGAAALDRGRKPLLPIVDLDSFEVELVELLSNEGGLPSDPATKQFLKCIRSVSLESHKVLCVSVLKQTKAPPALSSFSQNDGFKVIAPWLKAPGSISFKQHVVEFMASPRVRLEKRLDRESLRTIYDTVQAMMDACCRAGPKAVSPKTLTTEQANLRMISLELLRRLRPVLNLQTSSQPSSSNGLQKKKVSAQESTGIDHYPQKRQKIDSLSKFSSSGRPSSAPVPLLSGTTAITAPRPLNPPNTAGIGLAQHVTTNVSSADAVTHRAGPSAATTHLATANQLISSPFASFSSDKSYAAAPPKPRDGQYFPNTAATVDAEALKSTENRRKIRWADDDATGDLCSFKEFTRSSPPCPDIEGLSDEELSEAANVGTCDEDQEEGGITIDMSIDPRNTHNLSLMKKREHEGERQFLEQARKHKYPDPDVAMAWRSPSRRPTVAVADIQTSSAEGDVSGTAAQTEHVNVNSNELKIQKIRQSKKDEVFYLLTTEIPDDPDHVSMPISGNVRMPTRIPWEDEYAEEVPADAAMAHNASNDFYCPGDVQSPPDGFDNYTMDSEDMDLYDSDDGLLELLNLLPASVTSLKAGELAKLMELLAEDCNAALLENPLGEEFQNLVATAKAREVE